MSKLLSASLAAASLATVLAAQTPAPEGAKVDSHEQNIKAYVEALRSDVRSSKAQVMGAVMQLDSDDATKFLAGLQAVRERIDEHRRSGYQSRS
jgi:hypothetical protein